VRPERGTRAGEESERDLPADPTSAYGAGTTRIQGLGVSQPSG
jgi:hypothetical protein